MRAEEVVDIAWRYIRQEVGEVEWTSYPPRKDNELAPGKWIVYFNRSTKDMISSDPLILLVDDVNGHVEPYSFYLNL